MRAALICNGALWEAPPFGEQSRQLALAVPIGPTMTGQLLQFGGSLLAIFAVALLVHRLRLGGDKRIRDEAHARDLAGEVVDGFEATEIAVDSEGRAAIMRDANGQIMIVKMHGSKAAGRILGTGASARLWDDRGKQSLQVQSGEHWFGKLFLDIADHSAWKQAVDSIGERADA